VFPTQIEELLLKLPALSAHYQIVLTREDRLDEMEILIEARPEAGAEARKEASQQLAHDIKSRIGVSAKVTALDPGGIERSLGKARRVVDKRAKDA